LVGDYGDQGGFGFCEFATNKVTLATFAFEFRDATQAIIPAANLTARIAEIVSVTITATATKTSPTGTLTDSASLSTTLRPRLYGGS